MRTTIVIALLVVFGATGGAAPKKHQPGALVLLLDRSGSMQGSKLAVVKDAALAAIDALDPSDQIAIVMFDSEAEVVIPMQAASNRKQIAKDLAKVQAGGGTNVLPALQAAFGLLHDSKVQARHVILLSDGEAPTDGIPELVKKMHDVAKITITTVGVQGADRNLLSMIADGGAGRLYMVENLGALERVFMKEVKTALP